MNSVGDSELKDVGCSIKLWWTPCDIGTGTGAVGLCWVYRRGRDACGKGTREERRVYIGGGERKVGGGGEESEGGMRGVREVVRKKGGIGGRWKVFTYQPCKYCQYYCLSLSLCT